MNPSIHAAHGGYSRAQIALHWLSVALMCSLVLAGELRHLLVEHADMRMRPIMIVHIGSGMALLVVMLMRSALRAGRAKPIGATTLQQWCAHIVHLAMYVFVLGECLAGWVIVNAKGLVIPMPGTGWDFPVWWTPTRNWSATWSRPTNGWASCSTPCWPRTSAPRCGITGSSRTARWATWAVRAGAWRGADSACRTRPERRPRRRRTRFCANPEFG